MSHILRVGVADQIAYFRAFDTDGTGKTDLTSATTGLALSVFRVGLASVSIASLSAKAADSTTHADGAIRQVSGNLYTVDLPDAATATQTPSVGVKGSYTGGVIEPVPHPIVNYDPALAAVGANTTTPPTPAQISEQIANDIEEDKWDVAILYWRDTYGFAKEATVVVVDGIADSIKAKTDQLTFTVAGQVDANVSGSGVYTITVTVEDGSGDAIAGARVGIDGTTTSGVSNTSGTVTLQVNDGTYSLVTIPPGGYDTPAAASVTVSGGNETSTIVLTQSSVTVPADPTLATLVVVCVDEEGAVEADVSISARMIKIPSASAGYSFDAKVQTATSNVSGMAQLTVVRGATYEYKRGTSKHWTKVVIPDAASVTVTSVIGADE